MRQPGAGSEHYQERDNDEVEKYHRQNQDNYATEWRAENEPNKKRNQPTRPKSTGTGTALNELHRHNRS